MYLIHLYVVLIFICVLVSNIQSFTIEDDDSINVTASFDLSPQQLSIDAVAEHSFTLTWKPPLLIANQSGDLVAYSLTYNVRDKQDKEMNLLLPPNASHMMVTELTEGTNYRIVLAAVYDTKERVAAPEIYVTTLFPVEDLIVGDDIYPDGKFECNCSETGTLACTRSPHNMKCACYNGYEGKWCDMCSQGYFKVGEECKPCPCTNITSAGECILANGHVTCTSCLPGHTGLLCTNCTPGYTWRDDKCVTIDNQCDTCPDPGATASLLHSKLTDQSLNDGTIPLVAVVVTLAVLLVVAASATCYRYWSQRRTRLRLPFWSIELREDKMNLSSGCHYQQLDAATSRVVQAQCDDMEGDNNSPSAYRPLNA
ncbi:uncharacterized protein LOC111634522 isoform X1 [Centruroides sculpturatus]|uniref:uncharacterized protein LOC111634522 isoform X1 n=1 Tax=Centruroides sculpturatus TaxID=218467 RepID=UPI000C6EDB3E|nr:uncharacterized protein LOC111634522 isoform X1 [Centruroides sculpturatus]